MYAGRIKTNTDCITDMHSKNGRPSNPVREITLCRTETSINATKNIARRINSLIDGDWKNTLGSFTF